MRKTKWRITIYRKVSEGTTAGGLLLEDWDEIVNKVVSDELVATETMHILMNYFGPGHRGYASPIYN